MKLYIKDSKCANTDRFEIFDNLGAKKYRVAISFTSLSTKIDIFDQQKHHVAKIRYREILFLKTYTISACHQKIKVIGKTSETGIKFHINGINWFFLGDILNKNFNLINVDKSVVMVHAQKWSEHGTNYELNITESSNELLCICVALCIDIINVDGEFFKSGGLKNKIAAPPST